jgi:hypothetical protein
MAGHCDEYDGTEVNKHLYVLSKYATIRTYYPCVVMNVLYLSKGFRKIFVLRLGKLLQNDPRTK